MQANDPKLLGLARNLIDVYRRGVNQCRGEIETIANGFVTTYPDLKIAKGLNKLLLDRTDFVSPDKMDFSGRRSKILSRSSASLGDDSAETPGAFRLRVLGGNNNTSLYADLPINDRLTKFKELFPKQLLERYNVALVQGLLFSANNLTVRTRERKAENLRRPFKFLKFFRLLARIFRDDEQTLRIEISGPMSILDSARKYGLQLASFFPALCHLTDWQLVCDVMAKKRLCKLQLDHTGGLVSHYRNFSAYVPEEVMMFANHFKETVQDWSMTPKTPFIKLDGPEFMFPDFTLVNASGKEVYLELFHRWHRGNLIPRLRFCIENPNQPILLGIDRQLFSDDVKALLAPGVLPTSRYFTFSEYPTVGKVLNCLKDGFREQKKTIAASIHSSRGGV